MYYYWCREGAVYFLSSRPLNQRLYDCNNNLIVQKEIYEFICQFIYVKLVERYISFDKIL